MGDDEKTEGAPLDFWRPTQNADGTWIVSGSAPRVPTDEERDAIERYLRETFG